MRAYYNEIDPYAAQWIRNLIDAGLVTPGDVDTRSIEDVRPNDLFGYNRCHFFAGIAVWDHALNLAGWGEEQVWTGSCPCQPFSEIGQGSGFADERHLWPAFHHLVRECKPRRIFGEQVASAAGLAWLDLVHADMEAENYSFASVDLCAAGVSAPHIRQRLYWVGHANDTRLEGHTRNGNESRGTVALGSVTPSGGPVGGFWADAEWLRFSDGRRPVQPGIKPMVDRTPSHMGRCRAYGNAVVAPLAVEFIKAYMDCKT